MARSDLYDNQIRNPIFNTIQKYKPQVLSVAAPQTLVEGGPGLLVLNPGVAAINVTLYTPANPTVVQMLMIINSAAATGTLVVKSPAAATIATIAVGGLLELFWVGNAWLCFQTAKSA